MLEQLEKVDGVQSAMANHTGSMVRVKLNETADSDAISTEMDAILKKLGRKPKKLDGDELATAINNEQWRATEQIGELSEIEFRTLFSRRVNQFVKTASLDEKTSAELIALSEEVLTETPKSDANTNWTQFCNGLHELLLKKAKAILTPEQLEDLANVKSVGQQPNPSSPRYQGILRLENMLKGDDDDSLKTFINDQVAQVLRDEHGDEKLFELLRKMRAKYGTSKVRGARPIGPLSAELIFDDLPDKVSPSVSFELEENEPYRFKKISFEVEPQQSDGYCRDYNNSTPPDFIVASNGWMNYKGELSLEKLRGHLVWIEFSYIACGGCQMMKPHLHGLQHRFGPKGLVVIEINNGQIDTRDALAKELAHLQPNYPVLWDEDGKTCKAFGISTYGTAYLVGADGKVVWGGNPIELTIQEMSKLIYRNLRDVDLPKLTKAGDPLLEHNIVQPSEPKSQIDSVESKAQADRYSLGWDFAIRTADNSMLIEGVQRNGPAQLAGLRENDIIIAIDDIILADVPFDQLKKKLHQLERSKSAVTLGVRRDDTELKIIVKPVLTRK